MIKFQRILLKGNVNFMLSRLIIEQGLEYEKHFQCCRAKLEINFIYNKIVCSKLKNYKYFEPLLKDCRLLFTSLLFMALNGFN